MNHNSTQQREQRLPNLVFWTKVVMWGDSGVWLHRAQIQQRHQDCIRHIYQLVRLNTYNWIMWTTNGLKNMGRGDWWAVSRDSVCLRRTSREHYERVLQHLVSFVSVSVSFFMVSIFLLAQTEMAKCRGEREVWQLGKISVVLQHNKQTSCASRAQRSYSQSRVSCEMYLPVLVQLD